MAHVTASTPRDPNTLSNYNKWRTSHVTANLEIDFATQWLKGNVVLRLKSLTDSESKEIRLDTSYLDIKDVKLNGAAAKWALEPRSEPYGSPLSIILDKGVAKDKEVELDISLRTTDSCTALQWFSPAQTSNKKHPYMFSQCQAIHARSVFPCQDTPDVKATVDFNIRSRLPVVASGLPTGTKDFRPGKPGESGTLLYTFRQGIPIPSYLFAIASGDLASASVGPRSTVVTGPEELTDCKWELEHDMERFLEAAEKIVFPYAWTTYNVLVLPSSFPYGGMENPIFTFATPTIISKDRENIDVIAHELAHSWSGNLVSNASWEHFWLNEGWTTYIERRIQGAVHSEPHFHFSALIGWRALEGSVEMYGKDHEFTKLVPDLKGKDPDDAFSSIPYEKGFVFLYYLDTLVGREKWDKYIPHYFKTWQQKSLDSFEFKKTLLDFFASDAEASEKLAGVDWDTWFFAPGYPPKPAFDDTLAKPCTDLASKWQHRQTTPFTPKPEDVSRWTANQAVLFLETLLGSLSPLSTNDIADMGAVYAFDKGENVEVVARYFQVGLKARLESVYVPTAELLGKVGRMKFVRPLFRELNRCDRGLAVKTFEKYAGFYHPICRGLVEKDLFGEGRE